MPALAGLGINIFMNVYKIRVEYAKSARVMNAIERTPHKFLIVENTKSHLQHEDFPKYGIFTKNFKKLYNETFWKMPSGRFITPEQFKELWLTWSDSEFETNLNNDFIDNTLEGGLDFRSTEIYCNHIDRVIGNG